MQIKTYARARSPFARVHQVTMRCDMYQRPLTESERSIGGSGAVGAAIVQGSSVFYCYVCSLLKKCSPLFLLSPFVHLAPLWLYELSTFHRLYFSRLQLPLVRKKRRNRTWTTACSGERRVSGAKRTNFVFNFVRAHSSFIISFLLLPHRWLCHSSRPFVAVIFQFNSMRCN